MNTVDIRNMNNTQDLFWQIALPLTLVTLSLILFVAYSGEGLRERFTNIFSRKRRNQAGYASRAMVFLSERKEKPGWPDLIGMRPPGQQYERLFSWGAPQQQRNPFLPEAYGGNAYPASPEGLPARLDPRRGGAEMLPPYFRPGQPYAAAPQPFLPEDYGGNAYPAALEGLPARLDPRRGGAEMLPPYFRPGQPYAAAPQLDQYLAGELVPAGEDALAYGYPAAYPAAAAAAASHPHHYRTRDDGSARLRAEKRERERAIERERAMKRERERAASEHWLAALAARRDERVDVAPRIRGEAMSAAEQQQQGEGPPRLRVRSRAAGDTYTRDREPFAGRPSPRRRGRGEWEDEYPTDPSAGRTRGFSGY
jgi:hypothetical protein